MLLKAIFIYYYYEDTTDGDFGDAKSLYRIRG